MNFTKRLNEALQTLNERKTGDQKPPKPSKCPECGKPSSKISDIGLCLDCMGK